jgi:hypothetical protein
VFPISDDFDNPQFNGRYNPELWSSWKADPSYTITQQDGIMVFSGDNRSDDKDIRLHLVNSEDTPITSPYSMVADYMVDISSYGANFGPLFGLPDGYAECQVRAWSIDEICCFTRFSDKFKDLPCETITPGTWHSIRINFMIPNEFDFYIDEDFIGTIRPDNIGDTTIVSGVFIHLLPNSEKVGHGYFDDFSFGPIR